MKKSEAEKEYYRALVAWEAAVDRMVFHIEEQLMELRAKKDGIFGGLDDRTKNDN
jgi:hypothetical protein